MIHDVAIIGAGPAGLCLARALSGHGLSVVLLERQTEQELAEPAFDGREIALTHASQKLLEKLGLWQRLPADEAAVLRDAQVLNGPSLFALQIHAEQAGAERLGHLVANRAIRRAAFDAVAECADVQLRCEASVRAIRHAEREVPLELANGEVLRTRLLVAADSRFSETRRQLGIGARLKDFGKTMLVCRMHHQKPHRQTAWEWFGYGQTLALLPLNGNQSSVVLTLPPREIERLRGLDEQAFAREMEQRFDRRLGAMQLASERHAYPLIGAYAEKLVGPRCALIGDAAVGMHPVTAHGFNFGLGSVQRLSAAVLTAHARGEDIATPAVLARYERQHRLATWPLYQATNLLVDMYTDDRLPVRLLRGAGLRVAQGLLPLKKGIARHLTARG
ncbi:MULTISPECIES: 5-demethoxyubiquinol-8 5-hydroxylase UbiM [unclassified Pseudomonas]|uniref:5-demethoxyubiquinol-8 5-hydroxylase UbiM n=1 Tax=unclassified Pseudomonas TaxID=196821 RepID=UPI002447A76F|nr:MULTISPECIES: 5-demethoxyubiquinol-8 5-hydroxylase UbiM [unclassified Pseudomonas]MDG9923268.1 5-demethoxyubiquinol-8 5-hydroxylase UbiM [Pseudomonas sp. GD04045]MDH0034655.1 5-demethoxyubiquinol-8 5-hydroxylase UbiM [Pseudomonas sp. GD04019]